MAHRENHFFWSRSYGLQKIEPILRFALTGNQRNFCKRIAVSNIELGLRLRSATSHRWLSE
ncbi:MAG: hypothetical protein ACKPCM_02390, partial [Pseudanabaena sp.]